MRKDCSVPMQVLRTGREPTNCVSVVVGGGKPEGSLAVIAYYLSPSSEAVCDTFFGDKGRGMLPWRGETLTPIWDYLKVSADT